MSSQAGERLPGHAEGQEQNSVPHVGVPLDIQVVEVVCVFHLAGLGALQPLDDLGFHLHGYVRWQQREQEPLLRGCGGKTDVLHHSGDIQVSESTADLHGARWTTLSSKLKHGE